MVAPARPPRVLIPLECAERSSLSLHPSPLLLPIPPPSRQVLEAVRVVRIDNSGPVVTMGISPVFPAPFVMDNYSPSTVTVTYVSGPPITSVTFYKEMTATTSLIGTVTAAPWTAEFTAYEVIPGNTLTIKTVVYSSPGASQPVVSLIFMCTLVAHGAHNRTICTRV
jgi:hypothetical protein